MRIAPALALPLVFATSALATELKTWEKYRCIVDRAPFGAIFDANDPAFSPATPEPTPEEPVDEGPKLADTIKVSAITVYGGTPAAGFTDTSDGKSYYLYQGRSAGEFTLVEVHASSHSILLRKGEKEEELFLNGKGPAAETPTAAPAAASMGIRAVSSPQTASTAAKTPGYKDLQRQRFEEARKKARERAEEERRLRQEELSKLSKEEADKKLREYNLNLIRSGDGPPLPIELNREELETLGKEGFDVTEALQALDEKEATPKETPAERIRRRRAAAAARAQQNGADEEAMMPPAP